MTGRIIGTGSCVPSTCWDNDKLAEMVDTSDEWIRERTGIAQRYISVAGENTVTLSSEAAKRALENAGVSAEEIDLLIVATLTPKNLVPCTACEVQSIIGAGNATCFDLNAACTGFLMALNTAQAYLGQGIYRTVLIVGAETLSNIVDWNDRNTCVLFGDGAGAAVLRAESTERYAQVTHSVGSKGSVLTCASVHGKNEENNGYVSMDGSEVFKFAVSTVPKAINELLDAEGLQEEDVDYFVLHQANARIIQSVAKRMASSIEKFPTNMERYGNTSAASIAILLDELNRSGRLQRGNRIVLAGFGGGLSYGASLLTW